MSTKLKGTRSGHRSALTRLLRRFDDVKSNEEFDRDELSTILDLIIDKQRYLSDLNNQIISELSEEELEAEISDSDEYSITLETKIRKMRKFLEPTARSYSLPVTDSSLNPLAQSFDVNRNQTASFNSQLISQNNTLLGQTIMEFPDELNVLLDAMNVSGKEPAWKFSASTDQVTVQLTWNKPKEPEASPVNPSRP
ncbi:unnamed protein product [Mytilus edulis]|uniref:Uncharacterized protein n=1 Tax=Mytilus edulis TaxID=6550 RepID=A0A8S3RWP8_MYTED|nr:unnamed protein product [Mytilus edulis]